MSEAKQLTNKSTIYEALDLNTIETALKKNTRKETLSSGQVSKSASNPNAGQSQVIFADPNSNPICQASPASEAGLNAKDLKHTAVLPEYKLSSTRYSLLSDQSPNNLVRLKEVKVTKGSAAIHYQTGNKKICLPEVIAIGKDATESAALRKNILTNPKNQGFYWDYSAPKTENLQTAAMEFTFDVFVNGKWESAELRIDPYATLVTSGFYFSHANQTNSSAVISALREDLGLAPGVASEQPGVAAALNFQEVSAPHKNKTSFSMNTKEASPNLEQKELPRALVSSPDKKSQTYTQLLHLIQNRDSQKNILSRSLENISSYYRSLNTTSYDYANVHYETNEHTTNYKPEAFSSGSTKSELNSVKKVRTVDTETRRYYNTYEKQEWINCSFYHGNDPNVCDDEDDSHEWITVTESKLQSTATDSSLDSENWILGFTVPFRATKNNGDTLLLKSACSLTVERADNLEEASLELNCKQGQRGFKKYDITFDPWDMAKEALGI
ncbi:MAG: hypothetical protein H7A33_05405 [Deltaproteobacteria bacterium]|nr:hypothetical protein [Deltaproteobacteria bacterium]